jgi:histidyl-tRNA synthetase
MSNKTKILELINTGDKKAFSNWLMQQSEILQPDITREYIEILKEILHAKGYTNFDVELNKIEAQNNIYEETIIDRMMAGINLQLANENLADSIKETTEMIESVKPYIIECIKFNYDNAKEMRKVAKNMIKAEKQMGTYDRDSWEGVLF